VPKSQRDKKRVWTKNEQKKKLDEQGGNCANCGEPKTVDDTVGHHDKRHADGFPTDDKNHKQVCKDCHNDLHH